MHGSTPPNGPLLELPDVAFASLLTSQAIAKGGWACRNLRQACIKVILSKMMKSAEKDVHHEINETKDFTLKSH